MARRPDGRGEGGIREARWRERRSIRGTSFRGPRIVLVLSNAVLCYKGMRRSFWMSHASCIVNRLREERVDICVIIANEPIKIFTLT